ncbi:NAD-dependent epimerase/dehydratase family protein [Halanaerobium congolense]|uniref:NAD dependent epimerase/dehydratase family protein n=1 Tax=Halanaerobium congolense TaxID=54121 RepID=A0A1M7JUF5_9FIRM|nr:NAD-dependent epimerase/dehydratase family protein [Halanaerobium congolense]KXS47543.1 MAG: NAD-dependent epimerase/dehydratase [Halanaerobium sp. T82-1]OEG62725.1 MAG: UDP-glucose 4-epimerase [Halanaerobium sp. MDAL1]PTX16250.1 UDP-glucose 4-epimerase [Halanaerobium congolense]TDS31536.1 UDP-glucose 4-epimerase [Halanaerobium congolense]SDF46545.1 NAD dependent epimerase/dehydratase family protein [Halanaerobium congolense]
MKHLITGAAGFIGSNLAKKLLAAGEEVIGIDCFTDYYSRDLKERNIETILDNSNFTFLEKDLLKTDLQNLLKDVDYIYHQAAQAGVRSSWGEDFEIYNQNNILLTQKLLEAAKDAENLKKFVYASSSSVYGDTDQLPMQEDNRLQPVSPYGVSKLAGENLAYLYYKNFKVPTVSLRYFTVYGEGQRPDMAFHIFIKAFLTGGKINIFGDGKQSRNFTYVGDIARANILAAKKAPAGEIINIGGSGRGIVLNETLDLIKELTNCETEINYTEKVKGDVKHTSADTSKAEKLLGYQPRVSFEEGLEREVEWLQKIY